MMPGSPPPPDTPNTRRGSRKAVVGLQTLRLHVVNCGERREGLPGGEPSPGGVGSRAQGRADVCGGGAPRVRRGQHGTAHTGSCRGCWFPSWRGGWNGRPCGDPPCARRGSGTSCLRHPSSTPCRTAGQPGMGGGEDTEHPPTPPCQRGYQWLGNQRSCCLPGSGGAPSILGGAPPGFTQIISGGRKGRGRGHGTGHGSVCPHFGGIYGENEGVARPLPNSGGGVGLGPHCPDHSQGARLAPGGGMREGGQPPSSRPPAPHGSPPRLSYPPRRAAPRPSPVLR